MKALTLILAALIAQPFLPPSTPQPGAAPSLTKPESAVATFRVVGIAATNAGRDKPRYDEALKPYDAVFDALEDSDTFMLVSQEEKEAPHDEETEFVINDQYRLYVRPSGQSEAGNLLIETRIETNGPNGPIDAFRARGETQPNRAITFADMPLDDGELVVIMSLLPPPGDDQQQQPGDEEEQQESDEQQEQENSDSQSEDEGEESEDQQQEMPEESEGEAAEQDQEPEEAEGENGEESEDRSSSSNATEVEDKLDSQNIDALLESLEEIDQEEQRAAHNNKQKGKPRIAGEWW